jgi:plastocyanin
MLNHRNASWLTCALSGLLIGMLSAEANANDWMPSMREFADSFKQLEQSFNSGKFDKIPSLTSQMNTAASSLRRQAPHLSASKAKGLEAHAVQIELAATRLNQSAAANDHHGIAKGMANIRHTCMSCHVKFREFDHLTSFYPARGNTLIVDVSVRTIDGRPRQDHSNVVVFMDRVPHTSQVPVTNPRVSQANRRFHPRVLPIVKGTTVDFPNDDRILHNVFSMSKTKKFDLDVYQPGTSKSVTFPKPGLIRLYCNIHPEMACSILILDNPYFALTDSAGRCIILGIPDGEFTLRSWHEFGGETRNTVNLIGTSATRVSLQVKEKRRSLQHSNKYGQSYKPREKY